MATFYEGYLDGIRKSGSSIGAVIEVVAEGVPAGLGAPIYGKLDQDIASALMSINAVKGVEIGAGFAAAALTGEENAERSPRRRQPSSSTRRWHPGGSRQARRWSRFAVKPTSSILKRAARSTGRRGVDV
jgi:chorismate synthase